MDDNPADYVISARECQDIELLASKFTDLAVDSIHVGSMGQIAEPMGLIVFKARYPDTDKVVRASLLFCNTQWSIYPFFAGGRDIVNINGWVSLPEYLECDTMIILHFRSFELEFRSNGLPSKDTVIHYLAMIADSQYEIGCDRYIALPEVNMLNRLSTWQGSDTLYVNAASDREGYGYEYLFIDIQGRLILIRMLMWQS